MNRVSILTSATAMALVLATPVFSQGALVGIEGLDDQIDDIQSDVDDEFDKSNDGQRFGSNQYSQGWSTSLSASLSATSGNTDTVDFALGGRMRYGSGPWNHTIGLAANYAEANGIQSEEEIFATYDVNRYFTNNFYVFGLGSFRYDDFGTNRYDAFLGVGPGYRILNSDKVAWRVQAGPGVRYTEDQLGDSSTDVAGIASSRVYYKITDAVFLTNDTDVLYSNSGTLATNEFGVNFTMTDTLTTRLGYRTEYDSDPLPGLESFDNKLTAALVIGF